MVRAFVGDSTMTSRRRAGALLVATDASLAVEGADRSRFLCSARACRSEAGSRDGRRSGEETGPDGAVVARGRRKHGNAVGALSARAVHGLGHREGDA